MEADAMTKDGYIGDTIPAPHPNPLPASGERGPAATPQAVEGPFGARPM